MGVLGLGVDIVEIDRMAAALKRRPRLKQRIFSEEERRYCEKRSKPEVHYALRFAAKEAVLKALGTGFSGMHFTDVEVVREASGRPVPKLSGKAAEKAAELGVIEMHLSLSFTHTTAVASAVAVTAEARPRKDDALDPKAQLAASFKEARAMLDELDVSEQDRADGPLDGEPPQPAAEIDGEEQVEADAHPLDTEGCAGTGEETLG